jgi:hypothetical protein
MMTVARGKFRMLSPCRSVMGNWIIVGAIVGMEKALTYTKRVKGSATRDDLRRAYSELRETIHKEHRGVKEEFTIYRPKHSFN